MKFNLSKNISPRENFYLYVNDSWIKKTNIPEDKNRWGTFDIINEDNITKIKKIFKNKYSDPEYNKAILLYNSYMDDKKNNKKPKDFVKKFLNDIELVNSKDELQDFIYENFFKYGLDSVINFSVFSDFNNSNFNILHISSGGLGLPDRSYYFDKDKLPQRKKYVKFIKEYLKIFDLKLKYKEIYKLEKTLAKNTFTNIERRDPELMNNVLSFKKFDKKYGDLNVKKIFKLMNKKQGDINVINTKFLKNTKDGFIELWNSQSLDIWKNYFIWSYLRQMGSYMNIKTEKSLFNFYEKKLSGTKVMKPKWKRAIDNCEYFVGMIIGKIYTEKYFNSKSKEKVMEMIKFIKNVYKDRLEKNNWMNKDTKVKAIKKLKKINFKIGYPDKWRNYKDLNISNKNSFFQNVLNSMNFETKYDNSYLYKNVNKSLWFMNPQDVNAYYSPSYNEIVFPAGILQSPFFSLENDMALNFGGIGTVIAHELTHAFDDQGKKYDGNGNLNEWWNKNDNLNYKKITNRLSKVFSNYTVYEKKLSGDLTLGENIADLGGVNVAYNSLILYLKHNPSEDNVIDKLNQKERFFINFANLWKSRVKKEEAIKRITTDPHSPPVYRVNGILPNLKEFDNIFNITNNDKMFIKDKITIF